MDDNELIRHYQDACTKNDCNLQNFFITALYQRWKKQILAIAYRVWSRCRRLNDFECIGTGSHPGSLVKPAFRALSLAAGRYNGVYPFLAYARKCITGECYKYCIRECYVGQEALSRLPSRITSRYFDSLVQSSAHPEDDKRIFRLVYRHTAQGDYKLVKNSLSIGKVSVLLRFFAIHDQTFEELEDFIAASDSPQSEMNLAVKCIDSVIAAIKNILNPQQVLLVLYFMYGWQQKQAAQALKITEVNFTREKRRIEKTFTLLLWEKYPHLLPDKIKAADFRNTFPVDGDRPHFMKEADLIRQYYQQVDGCYRLISNEKKDRKQQQKFLKALYRTGWCRGVKLKELREIAWFQTQLQAEFPGLVSAFAVSISGESGTKT